jgi:hypothetical protein
LLNTGVSAETRPPDDGVRDSPPAVRATVNGSRLLTTTTEACAPDSVDCWFEGSETSEAGFGRTELLAPDPTAELSSELGIGEGSATGRSCEHNVPNFQVSGLESLLPELLR